MDGYSQSSGRRGRSVHSGQAGTEQIRRAFFIDAKSIRRIAREGLHDRRTVRKFLHDAGPPRYTLKVPRRRPVLEPFLPVIDQWLKDDEDRPSKLNLAYEAIEKDRQGC